MIKLSMHVSLIGLSVLTVSCCRPAPVPCRETVRALCHPVCSPLPPPADLPAGCRCTALSDTWPEAELRGGTPMLAPDLPWTTPATGSMMEEEERTKEFGIYLDFKFSLNINVSLKTAYDWPCSLWNDMEWCAQQRMETPTRNYSRLRHINNRTSLSLSLCHLSWKQFINKRKSILP